MSMYHLLIYRLTTRIQTLGEKTNPVPMELDIRGYSEFIAEGRARAYADG